MKLSHTQLGRQGELIATEYLKRKAYTIRHTNWRYHHLEIDLVAMYQGVLVFVEVKTRGTEVFGYPEQSVSDKKIKHLTNAAEAYIEIYDLDVDSRFDVISVIITSQNKTTIKHFEDAFLPLA